LWLLRERRANADWWEENHKEQERGPQEIREQSRGETNMIKTEKEKLRITQKEKSIAKNSDDGV
jgi:hypothetical protein